MTADESILKRIAAGDAEAVALCIQTYGSLIWSLARRYLNGDADAEDAVQDIFIELWSNAGRFDPSQSSETTFIAMIARRRLIDRIRFAQRRLAPDSLEDVLTEPSSAGNKTIEMAVEARDAFKALSQLRPEQRQVLQLAIVHGMSHQEISDRTGMPLGTVKTHARRGLIQAREIMGVTELNSGKEVSV